MLDDDTRDQIPLFELPPPAEPAPGTRKPEPAKTPAPRKTQQKTQAPQKPAPRETKRKQAAQQPPVRKDAVAKAVSGLVPEGDVRLTANIRQDLHLRLKIAAAHRRTTIGEIIEELVEKHVR
jgi:hypothetical protein